VAPGLRRRFRVLREQVRRAVRAGERGGEGRLHEVLRAVLRGVQLRAHRGGARIGGSGGGGNECPCYRDMLTAGPRKRPKCP